MPTDSQRVDQWAKRAPTKSIWPGAAARKWQPERSDPEIDFVRGVVIAVTDLYIHVETERHTLVKLMGESYAHYCGNCARTVPGNVTYRRGFGTAKNSEGEDIPIRFFCPWCGPDHLLRVLRRGDKVRLHYRFELDRTSGGWFAEVWQW